MSSSWERRRQSNATSIPVDISKLPIKEDESVLSISTSIDIESFSPTARSIIEPNLVLEDEDVWYDCKMCATNSSSTNTISNPKSALEACKQVPRIKFKPSLSSLLTITSKAIKYVVATTLTRSWKKVSSFYRPFNLTRHPRIWAIRIACRKWRIQARERIRNRFRTRQPITTVLWKSDSHAVAHLKLHKTRNSARDKKSKKRWNSIKVQEEINKRGTSGLRNEIQSTFEGDQVVKEDLHETI